MEGDTSKEKTFGVWKGLNMNNIKMIGESVSDNTEAASNYSGQLGKIIAEVGLTSE